MSRMNKPRLTEKVMDGLRAMLSSISAGEALQEGGELEDEAESVHAAAKWIANMSAHRRSQREARRD